MFVRILFLIMFCFPIMLLGFEVRNVPMKIQERIGEESVIGDYYTREIDEKIYHYIKIYNKKTENIEQFFFDDNLNEIGEPEIPAPPKLQKALEYDLMSFGIPYDSVMNISVTFQSIEIEEDALEPSILSVDLHNGKDTVKIDGIERSKEEIDKIVNEERDKIIKKAFKIESLRKEFLQNLAIKTGIEKLASMPPRESIDLYLTKEEILTLAKIDEVENISYYEKPMNTAANAIIHTNIDPWAIDYNRNGNGIGIYMSEKSCQSEIAGYRPSPFPPYNQMPVFFLKYDNLYSGSTEVDHINHAKNVYGILRTASPQAYIYCRGGNTKPDPLDRAGYNNNPPIDIETHSWGVNYKSGLNSLGNNYTAAQDKIFDNNVYTYLTPIFVAAGNNASDDWTEDWDHNGLVDVPNYGDAGVMDTHFVASPGKAFNVITVGAYDHTTMTQAPFSSFKNSEIGNNKPEISAPGVDISAGGYTISGTSQATPHAAAMAADLMTTYTWLKNKPQLVKAAMLASTSHNVNAYYQSIINDYYNEDQVGVGGIDFRSIYYEGHVQTWTGSNSQYLNWLTNGYIYIEYPFDVSLPTNSKLKIALAWLNRGDYIYANKQIGLDFDMILYDPNGQPLAFGISANNSYEFIKYNPTVSGTYTLRIYRRYNRDTTVNNHLSLWINKDS